MPPTSPLDYRPTDGRAADSRRQHLRRARVVGMVLLGVGLCVMFAMTFDIRSDLGWIDARSGTIHRQTIWLFGIEGPLTVTPSPFEKRLQEVGMRWKPDWRNIETTNRTLLNLRVSRSHGFAPPAMTLTVDAAGRLNDDEVRRVNQILVGTDPTTADDEAEQRRAVQMILLTAMMRPEGP